MNYIGLMSGTSMDAIDAVIISIRASGRPELKATHSEPYPAGVKQALQALGARSTDELEHMAQLDVLVGKLFARAANRVRGQAGLAREKIRAIGSHGQTVRHRPDAEHPFSLQIGNPAVIAEQTGLTTVADFRARDIAAGGQGAPLVPAFHQWVFMNQDSIA